MHESIHSVFTASSERTTHFLNKLSEIITYVRRSYIPLLLRSCEHCCVEYSLEHQQAQWLMGDQDLFSCILLQVRCDIHPQMQQLLSRGHPGPLSKLFCFQFQLELSKTNLPQNKLFISACIILQLVFISGSKKFCYA